MSGKEERQGLLAVGHMMKRGKKRCVGRHEVNLGSL